MDRSQEVMDWVMDQLSYDEPVHMDELIKLALGRFDEYDVIGALFVLEMQGDVIHLPKRWFVKARR